MRHPRKFIKPVAKAIGAVALLAALFTVFSAPAFPPPINIREADGNPILWGVRQLTVPNGWLGASSGGVATISASAVGSTVNADDITTGTLALARGGLGASLTDPGADRILFWDDSAGANTWLAPGNSIAITTTTLDAIQDIRTSASPTFLASTLSQTALGTTSTDGLVLQNTTAAAAGAQQISPRVRWTGRGWETDTGSSQQVDYIAQLVPVQGAAAPQARLDFNYQSNDAGYTTAMSLLDGSVTTGITTGNFQFGRLAPTQGGGGFFGAIFGQSNVSTGSTVYDSYATFELIHRSGMVDGPNQQTNELDWTVASTVNTGGDTKQKIAAIEVFLQGTTANDRGGEWRLDTKQDGGVLTNAIWINNAQLVGIGTGGAANERLEVRQNANANVMRIVSNSTVGTRLYIRNDDITNVGDSWIYYGVNAMDWVTGIDNSDGDKFKIEYGAGTLGVGANAITLDQSGNIGLNQTTFGTNAAKVLSFGGPATAPATRPPDVFTLYPFDVNGAGTMGMAWMSEDNGIGILGLRNGFGTTGPLARLNVVDSGGLPLLVSRETTNDGIYFDSGANNTHYNWLVASQYNVSAALEITPSTATGGTTFSTPTAVFTQTGNVGIGTTGPIKRLEILGPAGTTADDFNVSIRDSTALAAGVGGGIGFESIYSGSSYARGGVIKLFKESATDGNLDYALTFETREHTGGLVEKMRINSDGNVGIGTTSFGTSAAKVLSFGGPATAPTTRPPDVFTFYPFDVNGAGTMGLAWMSEDNGIGILGLKNGFGTITPDQFAEFEQLETITGAVTDGYAAALRLDPGYTAATALTVTRHNYIDVQNVSVAGAGPAAVTNAALFRFDAAAGTHLAVAAGVGNFDSGFIKVNLNGTLGYVGISSAAASATTTNANTLTIAADEDANEASSALIFEVDNVEAGRFNVGGNLLLNAAVPGESLLNGIVVPSGVAPTTRPADMVQFYVADQNGTATWGALNIVAETLSRYEIGADGIYTYRTDVAHGMTLVVPTDLAFRLHSSSIGGMNIDGYADTGVAGVLMQGFGASSDTTKSTSTLGHIDLRAWVKNGTTADAAAADSSMLTVRAGNTATRFILDADGDSHQDVGTAWTNFDEYDDVRLVNSLAASVSRPENPIKAEFVSFISHNKNQLEATGLVAYNEDGHHFVNMSKLTMLNTSAIRQVGLKVYEMERVIQAQAEEIQELRSRLSGMRTAKFSAVAP